MINPKEPLYSTYDTLTSMAKPTLLKGSEPVVVDGVTVIGTTARNYTQKVSYMIVEAFFFYHFSNLSMAN